MPDSLKLQSEAELASRKDTDKFVEYEFVDYKGTLVNLPPSDIRSLSVIYRPHWVTGTTHGFAIRPDIRYPDIVEAQKKSVDQIAAWFDKTLLV